MVDQTRPIVSRRRLAENDPDAFRTRIDNSLNIGTAECRAIIFVAPDPGQDKIGYLFYEPFVSAILNHKRKPILSPLIILFDRIDLVDAAFVTFLCQFRCDERPHDFFNLVEGVLATAQRQHVGPIMLAGISCKSDRITRGSPHTANLIGRHRTADPRTVDDHAHIDMLCGNGSRDGVGEVWVIDSLGRVRSEVPHLQAELFKKRFKLLFQRKATVIGADSHRTHFQAIGPGFFLDKNDSLLVNYVGR
jgi:hypothetical protein